MRDRVKPGLYSLILLGLAPLYGLHDLTLRELVRLLLVVIGLAWLVWRQRRGERLP